MGNALDLLIILGNLLVWIEYLPFSFCSYKWRHSDSTTFWRSGPNFGSQLLMKQTHGKHTCRAWFNFQKKRPERDPSIRIRPDPKCSRPKQTQIKREHKNASIFHALQFMVSISPEKLIFACTTWSKLIGSLIHSKLKNRVLNCKRLKCIARK